MLWSLKCLDGKPPRSFPARFQQICSIRYSLRRSICLPAKRPPRCSSEFVITLHTELLCIFLFLSYLLLSCRLVSGCRVQMHKKKKFQSFVPHGNRTTQSILCFFGLGGLWRVRKKNLKKVVYFAHKLMIPNQLLPPTFQLALSSPPSLKTHLTQSPAVPSQIKTLCPELLKASFPTLYLQVHSDPLGWSYYKSFCLLLSTSASSPCRARSLETLKVLSLCLSVAGCGGSPPYDPRCHRMRHKRWAGVANLFRQITNHVTSISHHRMQRKACF